MVNDYAAYLAQEAKSDLAAMHQFRILYSESERAFHLFFEGEEDSMFYMPEIRRRSGDRKLHIYVCGGKSKVLSAKSSISLEGYDVESCMFFVDRDLDDYLGTQADADEVLYITCNYSMENSFSSREALEIILDDFVRVSRADPEWQRIVDYYTEAEAEKPMAFRSFMAWSLAAKEAGSRPVLQNVDMSKIFRLTPDGKAEKRNGAFACFIKRTVGSGAGATRQATLSWARRLTDDEQKKWIRGKWELWWFQSALVALLTASSSRRTEAGGRAWKLPAALREKRIVDILGGRIQPPQSLLDYLDSRMAV